MNRVLQLSLVALGVVLLGCQAARADEKSHKKAAREALEAMDVEGQMKASIDVTLDAMTKASPLPAEGKAKIKKFLTKYMGYESLEDDLVKIYAKNYTEDELKEITAFYKTKTGKKFASKSAEITKLTMELGQKKVQENQAELIKILSEK